MAATALFWPKYLINIWKITRLFVILPAITEEGIQKQANMKKIFIRIMTLMVMVMMADGAVAQQLTEQQAKELAGKFLKERRSQESGVWRRGGGRRESR